MNTFLLVDIMKLNLKSKVLGYSYGIAGGQSSAESAYMFLEFQKIACQDAIVISFQRIMELLLLLNVGCPPSFQWIFCFQLVLFPFTENFKNCNVNVFLFLHSKTPEAQNLPLKPSSVLIPSSLLEGAPSTDTPVPWRKGLLQFCTALTLLALHIMDHLMSVFHPLLQTRRINY